MSAELEQELRRLFAARASELPPDASRRLLAADYRPRAVRRRLAVALVAATLTATVVLAASWAGFSANTPRAFAGWSATPTAVQATQMLRASAACRSELASSSLRQRGGQPGLRAVPRLDARVSERWRTVVTDTRGPYTLILFEAGHGRATSACFAGSRRATSLGSAFGTRTPAPVAPGQVSYSSSGSSRTAPDEGSRQFSRVAGRTGAGVTAVTVRLVNGTRVRATCANGWFVAWWPGSHGIRATEVTTAAGTKVG